MWHASNVLTYPGDLISSHSLKTWVYLHALEAKLGDRRADRPSTLLLRNFLIPLADIGWLPGQFQRVVCTWLETKRVSPTLLLLEYTTLAKAAAKFCRTSWARSYHEPPIVSSVHKACCSTVLTITVRLRTIKRDQTTMPEYTKMKKPELQALLKERGIPSSGNKDVLIDRLLDDDDLHAEPSTRQDDDNDGPLLDGVLEAL
jgi:hypothetical protein